MICITKIEKMKRKLINTSFNNIMTGNAHVCEIQSSDIVCLLLMMIIKCIKQKLFHAVEETALSARDVRF